jgi:hypothetical protein
MIISSKSLRVARLLFAAILIAQVIAQKPVPWDQTAKLSDPGSAAYDQFGTCVALYENTAFIYSDAGKGIVDVYQSNDNGKTWNQNRTSRLVAPNDFTGTEFGNSISAYNNTVLIGAKKDNTEQGSAYVFSTSDGGVTWNQTQKLVAGDGAQNDLFGFSVSIFKSLAVIGASEDDNLGTRTGSAYVFKSNDYGVTWNQTAKLLASVGSQWDYFGKSVSIHKNYILIGAQGDNSGRGAAYAYRTNDGGSSWLQSPKIIAFDGALNQYFGRSVSVYDQVALIGSKERAYLFRTADGGGTWGFVTMLKGSDSVAGDDYGRSVFVHGTFGYEYAIVGGYLQDGGPGSAYVFQGQNRGKKWDEGRKLVQSDRGGISGLGYSVALYGNNALVGAYADNGNRGAAYTFERCNKNCRQEKENQGQVFDDEDEDFCTCS